MFKLLGMSRGSHSLPIETRHNVLLQLQAKCLSIEPKSANLVNLDDQVLDLSIHFANPSMHRRSLPPDPFVKYRISWNGEAFYFTFCS